MRITHLAAENPRTQGARWRDWYRRHSPAHLRSVAQLVEAALAARGAGSSGVPGQAVILGAGACTEIPLERLCRACASVLLVDVDVPAMTRARDEVPAGLRDRVNLLAEDVTGGVCAALASELRAQPWDDLVCLGGPTGAAPLEAAAACLEGCPVPDPPAQLTAGHRPGLVPHGYDLVISTLVLTQLFSLPLLDVLDTLTLHAPGVADLRETNARYRAAAVGFRRRVALAHLSLLGLLLAPHGAGLLITDVTGHLLAPSVGTHASTGAREADESLVVLPPEVFDLRADLGERFALVDGVREWRWLLSAPEGERPGRAYDVAGVVFRSRP